MTLLRVDGLTKSFKGLRAVDDVGFEVAEGSILGTLVGTLLIGVLYSGLAINNVNPYYQPIIIGVIVVFSVFLDQLAKSRRRA